MVCIVSCIQHMYIFYNEDNDYNVSLIRTKHEKNRLYVIDSQLFVAHISLFVYFHVILAKIDKFCVITHANMLKFALPRRTCAGSVYSNSCHRACKSLANIAAAAHDYSPLLGILYVKHTLNCYTHYKEGVYECYLYREQTIWTSFACN